jgi:GT2 family glycosyltransferase
MVTKPEPAGVSVAIPTCSNARQVSRCLGLLMGSRGLGEEFSLEVIIVDDSPDDAVDRLVRGLALGKNPHVSFRYVNIGAAMASNEIVIATDSDIEVRRDTIMETLKTFREHGTAAMVSGNVYWKGGPLDGKIDRPRPHDRRVKVGKTTYIEMLHGRYVAFLKRAFGEAGGYDAELFPMQGEGPDISIRFWRAGLPLVHNPRIRVDHLSGMSGKEKPASPYLYHGWSTKRTMLMYRSILLYMCKYGAVEGESNWMRTISLEAGKNFGGDARRVLSSVLPETLEWVRLNWKRIEDSARKVPARYDFKPYDVFTDMALFRRCIREAAKGK